MKLHVTAQVASTMVLSIQSKCQIVIGYTKSG